MTAPQLARGTTFLRCLVCGDGVLRDGSCDNCGAGVDDVPPVVGGGQGRSAEDVEAFTPSTIAVAIVLVVVAFGLAAWAAATYWKGLPS